MKSKFKKGQRVPRNIIKMFALASTIGAIIKSNHNGDPKLTTLAVQVNRAMRVFNVQAGHHTYNNISHEVGEVWGEIIKKYTNKIDEEQVPLYIEFLCTLVSDKDFKDFLGVSKYKAENSLYIDDKVLEGILFLEVTLNKLYGCKPTTYSLKKITKLKEKPIRNTKVSRKQIKHDKEVREARVSKERKVAFLTKLREDRIKRESNGE